MQERDVKWVQQALNGDSRAFGRLVESYQHSAFGIAMRMMRQVQEAEDVVQESFLSAYANLKKFDQTQRFSTWLFRIVTNRCIDKLRKQKQMRVSLDGEVKAWHEAVPDQSPSPEQQVVRAEEKETMDRFLSTLPPAYRAVLVLRYDQGMSLNEIADVLSVPLNTVKTRLHRARELLRAKVEQAQKTEKGE